MGEVHENKAKRGFAGFLRALINAAVELLYPRGAWCPGCHEPIDGARGWLCDKCQEDLDAALITAPVCRRCGRPIPREGASCAECAAWPDDVLASVHAVYVYAAPVDNIVRAYKYRGISAMATWLGGMMAHRLDDLLGDLDRPDLLVPVPMHKAKQRKRGYNQAELLAAEMGALLHIPVVTAIARARKTRAQAGLTGDQRQLNLRGAFRPLVDLTGKHLLLIDDVLTTGSTALECAQTLRSAGATSVRLVVLAATIPREY